jgi:4-amino-4-deoxy-L-arabinose transferase-like glycosyltransferase
VRPDGDSRDLVIGFALALGSFGVYAWGSCRTIYVGDSGELVTAVHLLGIPHPTGYPLYVLLGKLWTVALPVGSVAWRMSLFSAACAAAACAVLFRLLRQADVRTSAAAFAALLFAFGPSFWAEANIQRVYALNALFVLLALGAAWRWHATRASRSFVLAAFWCGLGATNHTFLGVQALAFAVFAVGTDPGILRRPRLLAAAAAACLVGLLPYAWLPLRSLADPALDWGDPETFDAFADVVLRRDFWQRAWIEGPADLVPIGRDWLASFARELTWPGALLGLVGAAAGWRLGWPVGLPLLVMLANVAVLALHGSRSDLFLWHRYYIPSYAMAAVLAGLGCEVLLRRLPRAAGALPFALPLWLLVTGFASFDRSGYRVAEAFSSEVLRALPPGATLSASDDNILFSLLYLHFVEGLRPDVDLVLQGVAKADIAPLRFDPDRDALFFTHHPNWDVPGLDVVPVGLVFRVVRSGRPAPELVLPLTPLAGEDDPRVPKDDLTQNLIAQLHYMLGVTFETRDWPRARAELEAAARAAPANDVLFYNMGLIYARNGHLDLARDAFTRAHEINPRHLPSGTRPRASDRLAELDALMRE